MLWEKNWRGGKIKTRGKPACMVVAGYWSLDWLREGGWCCGLNKNLTGKILWEKVGMVGKNKNKRKTHRHRPPHATGGTGIMGACSCSFNRLREGGRHSGLNSNSTEKNAVRKVWQEQNKKGENSPSPSSTRNKQCRNHYGGTLFSWLTSGGVAGTVDGVEIRLEKEAVRKVWNGGK